MPPTSPKPTTVDAYIAALEPQQRETLLRMREAIRIAVPDAEESFSYAMPCVQLGGKTIVWYAAWKRHYSLYPMGERLLGALGPEVAEYETSRGTIRFPATRAVPYELVTRLVRARVEELGRAESLP